MAKLYGAWFMSNVLNGEGTNDDIFGMGFRDFLHGGGGRDNIFGGGGDDDIFGDVGNDQLFGEAGKDKLFGGDDDDILDGGEGNDILNGDAGNDTFIDIVGSNTIDGGTGRDTVDYSKYYGKLTVNLTEGTATRETIIQEAGPNGGQYFLFEGRDTLTAIENIKGGLLDDVLIGNGSANFIQGGRGNDLLTGKGGADYFVFADNDIQHGSDIITDFDLIDSIDLRQIDARTDVDGNQAFSGFVDRYTGHSGELILRVFSDHAILFGDRNGDGGTDFNFEIRGDMAHLSFNDFML